MIKQNQFIFQINTVARTFLLLILGFCFLTAPTAEAYLPSTKTILNRMTKKDLKGLYQVEQDVTFQVDPEPLVIREKWLIENGDSLRVTAQGPKASEPIHFEAVYRDGKKYFVDASGTTKTLGASPDFTESVLHYRSGKALSEALIRLRILPQQALQDRKVIVGGKPTLPSTDPWLRLGRVGGTIAWAFGEPTPIQAERQLPGLWVEQDSFLFKKLRFPSQAEVSADKPATFASGLRFPRERTVSWDTNQVQIRIVSVKALGESNAVANQLNPSSLNSNLKQSLPEVPVVKEFYSRFR